MHEWYFAFGSNLHIGEFCRRLGRDPAVSWERHAAILDGYALVFSKRSSRDPRIGYASVEPRDGARVEGVVYAMRAGELALMDGIELVPEHYRREVLTVTVPASGARLQANCYLAQPGWRAEGLRPKPQYIERMLHARALLSPHYARFLSDHETLEEDGIAPVA